MPRTDGIDVSSWQGVIDWRQVTVQWVGIRATVGGSVDSRFGANRSGASKARIRLLYDYLHPGADAGPFLRAVGRFAVGEVAMLDAEEPGITVADCVRWCQQVEAVTGRPVAVYTGKFNSGGTIWTSSEIFNGRRARIFAAYTDEARARSLAAPYGWDAWQWTSTGSAPGIGPNVDLDQVDRWDRFEKGAGLEQHELTPDDRAWFTAELRKLIA